MERERARREEEEYEYERGRMDRSSDGGAAAVVGGRGVRGGWTRRSMRPWKARRFGWLKGIIL